MLSELLKTRTEYYSKLVLLNPSDDRLTPSLCQPHVRRTLELAQARFPSTSITNIWDGSHAGRIGSVVVLGG